MLGSGVTNHPNLPCPTSTLRGTCVLPRQSPSSGSHETWSLHTWQDRVEPADGKQHTIPMQYDKASIGLNPPRRPVIARLPLSCEDGLGGRGGNRGSSTEGSDCSATARHSENTSGFVVLVAQRMSDRGPLKKVLGSRARRVLLLRRVHPQSPAFHSIPRWPLRRADALATTTAYNPLLP